MDEQIKPIDNQPEPAVKPKTIENIDQLMLLFARWHKLGNQKAGNMFDMPEGHEVEFQESEGAEPVTMVLEGDAYKGFRMGIMACAECFNPFPFTYSVEDAAVEPEDAAPGN